MEEQTVSSRRMCGAAATYYLAVESHPEYRQGQREVEIATAQMMAAGPETLIPDEPITIPLVAHVVYNDESANISDDQIESHISVLNQYFCRHEPEYLQRARRVGRVRLGYQHQVRPGVGRP